MKWLIGLVALFLVVMAAVALKDHTPYLDPASPDLSPKLSPNPSTAQVVALGMWRVR